MAHVTAERGARRVLVVRGADGLDEVSVSGRTQIVEASVDAAGDQHVHEWWFDPGTHGFATWPVDAVRGGEAPHNASVARSVLAGDPGPGRDIVVLNAGFALVAADQVSSIDDGVAAARESIDAGRASRVLDRVIELSATGA